MTQAIDFSGPDLKIERAKQHITELEAMFDRHLAANHDSVKARGSASRPKLTVIGSALPRHTPTILGDALHNLRAALDHAYCILIEANGSTIHDRSFFPIIRDVAHLQSQRGSVDGHKKLGHAPSDRVIASIFDVIQPYPGGNGADLVKLHVLDVADKHMVLLPSEQHTEVTRLDFPGGSRISGITFVGPPGVSAIAIEGDYRPEDARENNVTFKICFGRGQPYEGEPIVPTLHTLLEKVRSTLQTLKSA